MEIILALGTLFCSILGAIIGGVLTGIVTVSTLKNDISWIKNTLDVQGRRIYNLEKGKNNA